MFHSLISHTHTFIDTWTLANCDGHARVCRWCRTRREWAVKIIVREDCFCLAYSENMKRFHVDLWTWVYHERGRGSNCCLCHFKMAMARQHVDVPNNESSVVINYIIIWLLSTHGSDHTHHQKPSVWTQLHAPTPQRNNLPVKAQIWWPLAHSNATPPSCTLI